MFLSLPSFSISSPQQVAFEEIQRLNVEAGKWYSDPEGLGKYISNVLPDMLNRDVDDIATPSTNFQKALDIISYTIDFLKIPCIALVDGGKHWVVIDGIRFNREPSGKQDVVGLFIRDPWKTSPDFSYISVTEFQKTKFLPNMVGSRWKDQYVVLTKPTSQELLVTNANEIMIPGGGFPDGASSEEIAIENLRLQGFENVEQITIEGGGAPILVPVHVEGLDGASNYTIVPLDATKTREFQDFIYAAIEYETNTLIEVSSLPDVLQIFSDQEVQERLEEVFPGRRFEIIPGYFWKPSFELRSRLAVARRFKLDDQEMILLPDGSVVNTLTDSIKGG
jgi:hypothetical protein